MAMHHMLNGNAHLAQDSMPIIETGFALAYRTGVNKGPGFWFAVFLSLLWTWSKAGFTGHEGGATKEAALQRRSSQSRATFQLSNWQAFC